MFKKMKLRQRILLGYLIPFLLLLAVMALVYSNLQAASQKMNVLNTTARFTPDVLALGGSLVRIQRAAYAYVLMNGKTAVAGGYPKKIFENSEQQYQSLTEKLASDATHQDALRRLAEIGSNIIRVNRHYMTLIDEGKEAEAIAEFRRGESVKLAGQIDPLVDGIVKTDTEHRDKLRAAVADAITAVQKTVVIGTAGAMLLMVAFGLWIATVLSRNIAASASQLSAAASEIAAAITQHERTASQQAVAANETSATLEELSASSRQSSEQAENAAAVAEKATTATVQGGEATHQAVLAMGGLKERIAAMADQILRLGEQTGQIGSIATLVKDLSGQINMLALNAAVEAARAGEHGKGFAVVAGEVRKLADQSKKSAEQATALVADIQKATNSSIMMTEEGTRTVNEVTQLAQKVAELFNNISGMAGNVNENAQQVMLNAKQQSAAFTQIVEATSNIAVGAKETAAGISQTKVGVQKLNEAAENLKAIA
ncbi:MAG TPA: methyl-accepting chemotaxis protein [Gallionella sp.]|nr:methyl-accepting chemotaxis protein [Gallionella sp.]